MSLSLSSVLRRRPDVRFRRVGDESVVVRQSAGEVLVLNGVGGRVLELVDGTRSLEVLLDVLEAEYDADRTTITREVLAFAGELEAGGLLETAPEENERA